LNARISGICAGGDFSGENGARNCGNAGVPEARTLAPLGF